MGMRSISFQFEQLSRMHGQATEGVRPSQADRRPATRDTQTETTGQQIPTTVQRDGTIWQKKIPRAAELYHVGTTLTRLLLEPADSNTDNCSKRPTGLGISS